MAISPEFFESVLRMWDFSKPAESLANFRQNLETASPDGAALLQSQIARAQGLLGDFASADATLDTVGQGSDHPPVILALLSLERGRIVRTRALKSAGDSSAALPHFTLAFDRSAHHPADPVLTYLAVDAAHMVALASPDEPTQLDWTNKALGLARASTFPLVQRWQGSLLNNLGWIHHDAGRFEQALATFREAEQFRRLGTDARALHIARWCVARALRSLGQHAEALEILTALDASDPYVTEEIEHNRKAAAASVPPSA
jgi:tetratricopeptide (TPR) repeat protein